MIDAVGKLVQLLIIVLWVFIFIWWCVRLNKRFLGAFKTLSLKYDQKKFREFQAVLIPSIEPPVVLLLF